MKLIRILFACCCLMLFNGCSTIQSHQMLCLINRGDEFHEVKRKDWITEEKSPYFGKWRPPLYGFNFWGNAELIVYPIILTSSSIDGPAFIPIIPSPKALCHPEDNNLLRFVYSGNPEDICIEMADDRPVDPQLVKKTKTLDGTMIWLQLDESLVADGKLTVKLSCQGKQKTLEFVKEKFSMFIPFIFPASS